MKQTVTILTALMVALLLVSGFIVMGSMRQSELLMEREDQLLSRTEQLDAALTQLEERRKAEAENAQQMQTLETVADQEKLRKKLAAHDRKRTGTE